MNRWTASEAPMPSSAACGAHCGQRPSATRSGTMKTPSVHTASRLGPSPSSYCSRSACSTLASDDATVSTGLAGAPHGDAGGVTGAGLHRHGDDRLQRLGRRRSGHGSPDGFGDRGGGEVDVTAAGGGRGCGSTRPASDRAGPFWLSMGGIRCACANSRWLMAVSLVAGGTRCARDPVGGCRSSARETSSLGVAPDCRPFVLHRGSSQGSSSSPAENRSEFPYVRNRDVALSSRDGKRAIKADPPHPQERR